MEREALGIHTVCTNVLEEERMWTTLVRKEQTLNKTGSSEKPILIEATQIS